MKLKHTLILLTIVFPISGFSVCDYSFESPGGGILLVKKGASVLNLLNHYSDHYHGVECHGSRLYWIRRPSGEKGYLKDTLLVQDSLKAKGKEVFSCSGLDFRASESGNLIALNCGGDVAIKDMSTQDLFKFFPKKAPVTREVFKKSVGDDGPSLIGVYGNKVVLGDSSVGGWSQLCTYTWPEPETKCARVPFSGLSDYSIDPTGEYALFTTRSFEYEPPPEAYWNEPMEINAYDFRSKKKVLLVL